MFRSRCGLSPILLLIALLAIAMSTPAGAGMTRDLADCRAADRPESAAACTRILNSGRLPESQHYIAYLNRGAAHRHAGEDEKALADFDRAAELEPSYADTFYNRALVHHVLGSTEKAIQDLDRCISLKPGSWPAYWQRAAMRRELKDARVALADLDEASALKPNEPMVKLLKALLLSDDGDQETAMRLIGEVTASAPDKAAGYWARGLVSFRRNELGAADADAAKALSLQKDFAAALVLKGRIAARNGDEAAARDLYEEAIRSPKHKAFAVAARTEAKEQASAPALSPSEGAGASERNVAMGCRRFLPIAGASVSVPCGR